MKFFQFFSISLIILFSGCTLRDVDTKIGEIGEKIGSEDINNSSAPKAEKRITDEQKEKIEAWLEENGLNDYGEAIDMIYEKGAPLLSDGVETVKDRYKYIIDNHKEILDNLK